MLVSENFSNRTLAVYPAFASESTKHSDYKVEWLGIERVQKTGDFVFLYVTAISAFIIPKRAFSDEAAFERFYEKCLEYWHAAQGRNPAAEAAV